MAALMISDPLGKPSQRSAHRVPSVTPRRNAREPLEPRPASLHGGREPGPSCAVSKWPEGRLRCTPRAMLDLRYVVENLDTVRAQLARRSPAAAACLDEIAELSHRRVEVIKQLEALRQEKNAANEAMAKADKKSEE